MAGANAGQTETWEHSGTIIQKKGGIDKEAVDRIDYIKEKSTKKESMEGAQMLFVLLPGCCWLVFQSFFSKYQTAAPLIIAPTTQHQYM